MIEQPALASRILKALVPSLVAIIAICMALISMWPDRRYAPDWRYRLGLFNGRPTIERCERSAPPLRTVFFCEDVFSHFRGVMDIDTDADGVGDYRMISGGPGTADFYELGHVPMPIPAPVFLERTTGSPTGRMLIE